MTSAIGILRKYIDATTPIHHASAAERMLVRPSWLESKGEDNTTERWTRREIGPRWAKIQSVAYVVVLLERMEET